MRKRVFNVRRKRAMRDTIKEIGTLIVQKKKKEAEALLPQAYSAIDKAFKRGVMKKNTAARKKSRLVARIRRIS